MKPTIPDVLPLIKAYRDAGHHVGGNLHVVLDEGNIRDSDILFCRDEAIAHQDHEGVKIANLLLQMSKTQRSKISSLFYRL